MRLTKFVAQVGEALLVLNDAMRAVERCDPDLAEAVMRRAVAADDEFGHVCGLGWWSEVSGDARRIVRDMRADEPHGVLVDHLASMRGAVERLLHEAIDRLPEIRRVS